jgi:hypothetical protein
MIRNLAVTEFSSSRLVQMLKAVYVAHCVFWILATHGAAQGC